MADPEVIARLDLLLMGQDALLTVLGGLVAARDDPKLKVLDTHVQDVTARLKAAVAANQPPPPPRT